MKNYTGVYELAKEADSITEALGITEERAEILKNLTEKIVNDKNRVSETLEALWGNCDHPNEFAWMAFIYGAQTGSQRVIQDILKGGLKDILDKLK